MKKARFALLLAILFALLATPVFADDPDGDVVIWGDSYTLESGERISGDLLVYGGNVTLEDDSEVDGNVILFGGNLTVAGDVDGDITVWGGNVKIKSGATVRGAVHAIGGDVDREEGADVRGEEIEGFPFTPPKAPEIPETPSFPRITRTWPAQQWQRQWFKRIGDLFRGIFGMVIMVVLGILVVVFIPNHTNTVAETIVKAPLQSFLTGLVAWIGVPIVALILTLTICLSPVAALVLLIAGVAVLFGWIAAGLLLGVKVVRAVTNQQPNPVVAVAAGILLLSLLTFIPCLGALLTAVVLTWSMGAVAYSFFGTRAYNEPPPKILSTSKKDEYDPRIDTL
jgi:hypothetical protein